MMHSAAGSAHPHSQIPPFTQIYENNASESVSAPRERRHSPPSGAVFHVRVIRKCVLFRAFLTLWRLITGQIGLKTPFLPVLGQLPGPGFWAGGRYPSRQGFGCKPTSLGAATRGKAG